MKMERIKILILSVLLSAGSYSVFSQTPVKSQEMSFDQALDITRQKNHALKQMDFLKKEKTQQMKATRALYLPNIGISAQYIGMSEDLHLDLTPVKDAIVPLYSTLSNYGTFTIPNVPNDVATQTIRNKLKTGLAGVEAGEWDKLIQKKQFGTIDASFNWPLYVGGKIRAANNAAKIQTSEASEIERQKLGEIYSELVERYFGLCLSIQAEKVREDVLNGMAKHLSDAEKMEIQGMIAHGDVLHVKVFHAQAERELSKSRRQTEIVNQSLLSTMSTDEDTKIQPSSMLFYLDSLESIDFFKKSALQNSPLLKQVEAKKQLSIEGLKAEKADYFPALAVIGMYDIANKDLSPYTPEWMVGVGLKWTLFDGMSRYRKVQAATMKTEQVKEYHAKATNDIETAVTKYYQELNMYREQLNQLETDQQFTEELLRIREKSFQQDMTNSTEVVDARLALSKVLIEKLEAMFKYDVTLAKLLEYAGIPEQFQVYQNRLNVKTGIYKSEIK
jgi:outer membrane protein TolC